MALTLSQVRQWSTDYLSDAAGHWTRTAEMWEGHFSELANQIGAPGGTPWHGEAADAAFLRAHNDRMAVIGMADQLHAASGIARAGANEIAEARRLVLRVVDAAQGSGFTVGEDFSVRDPRVYDAATAAVRQAQAAAIAADLRATVGTLVATDADVATKLTAATAGLDGAVFEESADEPRVVLVDDVHREPTITGPATPPQPEQNVYDLQNQFADGQGPTFGGDPREGFPRSPASELAQGPPGTRPLPTGTALGPDGRRYGFFSDAPNIPPTDNETNPFVSNGSVWDYTNPEAPVKVGDLPGIFQASGAYDPATKRMVVIGNTSARQGDLHRGMWLSAPVDAANPHDWINTLQPVPGTVGLPGDRESQLIALKGGGYMLVGATNGGPISALTASTPQGLIGGVPQPLIEQAQLPTVYGPTVTGTTFDPATGLETVQLRVSTWPPNPDNPNFYDPHTWTTSVGVQH